MGWPSRLLADRKDLRTVSRALEEDRSLPSRARIRTKRLSIHNQGPRMLSDTPAALPAEPVETTAEAAPPIAQWGEMALTVMFTLAAVLFVSFVAVITGLV